MRYAATAVLLASLLFSPAQAEESGPIAHLRALQEIASSNGGNRAAGTPGYDRSGEYVAARLSAAGYAVRIEEFSFPYFEERSPPVLMVVAGETPGISTGAAVRTLAHSGSGNVTGPLRPVDLSLDEGKPPGPSTSGCEVDDFVGFERGAVALVRRGTCPFQQKAENAIAAGAAALVIMNEGTTGRVEPFSGTLTQPATIPVIGVPFEAGRALAAQTGSSVRVQVDAVGGTRLSHNVVAETAPGPAETIVVGAHLDSVPEGPGMNDNASGSAVVLESALWLARSGLDLKRRVRFGFWGAEERGLVGSRHHLAQQSDADHRATALYLNLDMVGSPNFGRFVQARGEELKGLQAIGARALLKFFEERSLPVQERFGGRGRGFGSDDASFAEKGIPTLGLYTGAGETKDEARALLFGGRAETPYDPCYHKACDTLANVHVGVLQEMQEALMAAIVAVANANDTPAAP